MGSSSIEYNQNLFKVALWPLVLYGVLAAVFVYQSKANLFSWHPFFMTTGFISLAGNAALIKKIGGYKNTKMHGYLMTAAIVCAAIGWYIIHENKNRNKKMHLLTLHGKMGAAVVVCYFMIGIFGFVALHPDYGVMKNNQNIRLMHKWGGRVLTAVAWVTSVLGLLKLPILDFNGQVAVVVPLIVLGIFVLL